MFIFFFLNMTAAEFGVCLATMSVTHYLKVVGGRAIKLTAKRVENIR